MAELHDTIVTIIQGVSRENKPLVIAPDESLFDTGVLDSFGLPELVAALEHTFGIKIPDSDLASQTFETVNHIAAYVQSRR